MTKNGVVPYANTNNDVFNVRTETVHILPLVTVVIRYFYPISLN